MAYVTKINGYDIKDSEARSAVSTLQESTVNAINEIQVDKIGKIISKTWAEIKVMRDGGTLAAGQYYRITDYVTTTVQTDTQSAGHAFDVIVHADSASVLNENAFAIQHEGDTYFANSNLSAWKLKYCLDNDATRFVWADTTNGKGVIYRMIDEFDNDLPYDFKNIQFKRYKANGHIYRQSTSDARYNAISAQMKVFLNSGTVNTNSLPYYYQYVNTASISGTWYDENGDSVDGSTLGTVNNFLREPPNIVLGVTSEYKYFYTFSYMSGVEAEPTDATISYKTVYKNKFGWGEISSNALKLGANVFIGNNVYSNTVGNKFYSNTVGNDFYSNTVGNKFNFNMVGNNFYYNTVGNDVYYNTVGNYFNYNTVGNKFYSNTVGNNFNSNTVGNNVYSNTVGNDFYYNTVGNYFNYNTVGNDFNSNTVGNKFNFNTVGNYFNYNTVGNNFNYNTVGKYYKWNHVEDGCSNLNFSTNGTSSSYVQKYRVLAGTAPSTAQTVSVTAGNTIPFNVKQTGANAISVSAE